MKDWFDKVQINCIVCKHRWILVSNKTITDMQQKIWMRAVLEHHAQIEKEKED